eukprot:TRINITY_DN14476_c0_g1_i1.p1 TRINITY_DN14476_c0_g1~~TRINITY_DN14476_c0_g1_i1.p1  ORF type:complete len:282 (-),score=63.22 TRINITY_DN14476_c0_g1_i1:52-897(-)
MWIDQFVFLFFFFFKQKTAYEIMPSLVGSEMCIRDRYQRRVHGRTFTNENEQEFSKDQIKTEINQDKTFFFCRDCGKLCEIPQLKSKDKRQQDSHSMDKIKTFGKKSFYKSIEWIGEQSSASNHCVQTQDSLQNTQKQHFQSVKAYDNSSKPNTCSQAAISQYNIDKTQQFLKNTIHSRSTVDQLKFRIKRIQQKQGIQKKSSLPQSSKSEINQSTSSNKKVLVSYSARSQHNLDPVSYTHLTLPTICSVQISVVAVSLKKKKPSKPHKTNCTIQAQANTR